MTMDFKKEDTKIQGVFVIRSESKKDDRGSFQNIFRRKEVMYANTWGSREVEQINISRTKNIGCIRGLHLQRKPYEETKLVRCLKGCVWDVAVDLRKKSATFGEYFAVELSEEKENALLIPEGCAHGFQVLESNSELIYLHSAAWVPKLEIGVRFNDPLLSIKWPLEPTDMSEKDLNLPFLKP